MSWNWVEAHATVKVCGPPNTSREFSTVWTPGFSSCWYWKGGTLNTLAISEASLSSAMVASGGDMPTVSGSSLAKLACPHCFAAAICNIIACTEIFTAGTAILSFSV